jgi:inorganic triphosphatase YgiF
MPVNIEREMKFRLSPEAARRLWRVVRAAKRPARRELRSVYYDTRDLRLRRAGMALRLRRDGRRWIQTLKAEGAMHSGVAVRSEWEKPLRHGAIEVGAFPQEEILLATGVDLQSLALEPIFETRFNRRFTMVALERGTQVELALDEGCIVAPAGKAPILELEAELKAGELPAMVRWAARLAEPLALELELESKAERGYRLAEGVAEPPPRKWRKPPLDELRTPQDAFVAFFSAALLQAAANARGVARQGDPEYLHQLRIGLRRLRSTLRAFRSAVPKESARALAPPLAGLMPALGAARDWDVFFDWLSGAAADRPPLAPLLPQAARRRAQARAAAAGVAASREFHRFVFAAFDWLQAAPLGAESAASLAGFARDALQRLYRKTVRSARGIDWGDVERRHDVRIRIKRLRYASEYFAGCFAPESVQPFLKRAEALQELLGELTDIAVARSLLAQLDPRLRAAVTLARRQLAARERAVMKALEPAWRDFGKRSPFWR